ncbi:conserved hypothetical protein [Photobacterium kishitanii]|nr:conserved hypothetical protein [Photobacterium kishitanii]
MSCVSSNSKYTQAQQVVIERVINSIPAEIVDSFNSEQRIAIEESIVINSYNNNHCVDFRPTIGIGRWRYYVVFLLGKDRRKASRHQSSITTIIKVLLVTFGLCFMFISAVLTLYLIKSALGIDIFKHFSFGIWDYFKAHFLN